MNINHSLTMFIRTQMPNMGICIRATNKAIIIFDIL